MRLFAKADSGVKVAGAVSVSGMVSLGKDAATGRGKGA